MTHCHVYVKFLTEDELSRFFLVLRITRPFIRHKRSSEEVDNSAVGGVPRCQVCWTPGMSRPTAQRANSRVVDALAP